MLKKFTKKIFAYILIYFMIVLIFVSLICNKNVGVDVIYIDFYIFFIIMLLYGNLIYLNKLNCLEINRFKSIFKYVTYKIKCFSLLNMIMIFGISFSNSLILLINSINLNLIKVFHYTVHLFIIFELLYFLCLSLDFFKNCFLLKCVSIFIFVMMYIVGILNNGNSILLINIFDSYFHFRLNFMNYIVWFLIPCLILYNKKEKIELWGEFLHL